MPRRRHPTSPLSVVYFVVITGLLVGSSVWLDRRGETAVATVTSKHEEITIQQEPRGGWDRWYRVGVEFPARDNNLGMATLTLPRRRYDALRVGDTIGVHYFPAFPLLARAADRTTLQAAGDAAFAALTNVLERGQAAGQVRRGAVRDQALAAWSLVHGLTTLLIDQRVSFLGISTGEAERHARLAGTALFEGLRAKTA